MHFAHCPTTLPYYKSKFETIWPSAVSEFKQSSSELILQTSRGAMEAAQAQLKEQAKLKIEDEVAGEAPGCVKPFFMCCGGPVGTVEKCMCMVAAEKQDNVKKAIEKYRKL